MRQRKGMLEDKTPSADKSSGSPITRRTWLGGFAAAGAVWSHRNSFADDVVRKPGESIRIAQIGVGGQGAMDLHNALQAGAVAVAFCDVDVQRAGKTYERYPDVPRYTDYRVMLDELEDSIDAVVISTPVHGHAVQAIDAIRRGKHVFIQSPLARTYEECQRVLDAAQRHEVIVRLGHQAQCEQDALRLGRLMESGDLGDVTQIHAWTNRPHWRQGFESVPKPTETPVSLDWDLWLGPSSVRPFAKGYLPEAWRAWWDFGCGAMGDRGPQLMGVAMVAFQLGLPDSVVAKSCTTTDVSFPLWSIIELNYQPCHRWPRGLRLTWHDGKRKPELPTVGPMLGSTIQNVVSPWLSDDDQHAEHDVAVGTRNPTKSGSQPNSWKPSALDDVAFTEGEDPGYNITPEGWAVIGSGMTIASAGMGDAPLPIDISNKAVDQSNQESEGGVISDVDATGRPDVHAARHHWANQFAQSEDGHPKDAMEDWFEAIRVEPVQTGLRKLKAQVNLQKAITLGCLATRFPNQKLFWDSTSERFRGETPANEYLAAVCRSGFDLHD